MMRTFMRALRIRMTVKSLAGVIGCDKNFHDGREVSLIRLKAEHLPSAIGKRVSDLLRR